MHEALVFALLFKMVLDALLLDELIDNEILLLTHELNHVKALLQVIWTMIVSVIHL